MTFKENILTRLFPPMAFAIVNLTDSLFFVFQAPRNVFLRVFDVES